MPVYSSHLLDYQGLQVCDRIREERQRKGHTLRQMARRLGISPAQLSKIETGRTTLDLAKLQQIAGALEVPLSSLFPRGREYHYLIRRGEHVSSEKPMARELMGPEPGPRVHHNPVWPLAERFVGKHIEPVMAEIRPLAEKDLHFIGHDHEEFMFVLE